MLKIFSSIGFAVSLCLPGLSYSAVPVDNVSLSHQCHEIAKTLREIRTEETSASCSYKLYWSMVYTDNAGERILEKNYPGATEALNDGIKMLIFAQKFNCNRIADIIVLKKGLIQIRRQLK